MLQCTQHALHIFLKQQIQTLQKKFQTCTLFTVGEWVSGKPSSSYSDLTKVCVTINGSPNMLHSNGIESTDMLEAASGFFVKEKKIALSIGICKSSTPKKRSDLSPTPSSTWAYSWILCSINSSSTTKSLQYPLLRSHRGAY